MAAARMFEVHGSEPTIRPDGSRGYARNFRLFIVAKNITDAVNAALDGRHEDSEVHQVSTRTSNTEIKFAPGWDAEDG